MKNKLVRVRWVALWPVYYHVPIYKELFKCEGIDLDVLYLDNVGIRSVREKDFGTTSRDWRGLDLLSGYRYKFLKNFISHNNDKGFFLLVNPGIVGDFIRSKPDVVVLQSYATFSDWLALIMSKLVGAKIIFRGEATLKNTDITKSIKSALKSFILRRWLNACDIVMYSCTGNAEYWRHYGVSDSKMYSIPCSVDNDYFSLERHKLRGRWTEIRVECGLNEKDYVIISVSKLTKNKNLTTLIDAVGEIDSPNNIVLLIVGDGPEKVSLEKHCARLNVKSVFVGYQHITQVSKFYFISDLFALLSRDFENSPKSLNEAMNFKLPVLVTSIAGTAVDLVSSNGYVVDPLDVTTISKRIGYLSANTDMSKKMGEISKLIIDSWTPAKGASNVKKSVMKIMSSDD